MYSCQDFDKFCWSLVPLNRLCIFDSLTKSTQWNCKLVFNPPKRLTIWEIQLVLFCWFLSWSLWKCAGLQILWHLFYVKAYLSGWSDGFQICFQNEGSCHAKWQGLFAKIKWLRLSSMQTAMVKFFLVLWGDRAAILCQLFSQRTKPSVGEVKQWGTGYRTIKGFVDLLPLRKRTSIQLLF